MDFSERAALGCGYMDSYLWIFYFQGWLLRIQALHCSWHVFLFLVFWSSPFLLGVCKKPSVFRQPIPRVEMQWKPCSFFRLPNPKMFRPQHLPVLGPDHGPVHPIDEDLCLCAGVSAGHGGAWALLVSPSKIGWGALRCAFPLWFPLEENPKRVPSKKHPGRPFEGNPFKGVHVHLSNGHQRELYPWLCQHLERSDFDPSGAFVMRTDRGKNATCWGQGGDS